MQAPIQKLLLALLAVAIALFSGPLSAEVQLTSGKYHETVEDLRVKVLGGFVIMDRTWYDGRWQFNRRWNPLTLRYDTLDGSLKSIERNGDSYAKVDTAGTVFKFGKRLTVTVTTTGFRWQDREGNWIDYDNIGHVTAYGDRNQVKVTLTYDQTGHLNGVLDQHGTQVLWLEYDATGHITAVRDYTDRRVQYHDSGEQLTTVTDVMGNPWSYEYGQGQLLGKTDPEGRTTRLTYSGTGMVTRIKDPDGAVTTYSYTDDSVRKLFQVQATTAGGRVDEYWYNREGYQTRQDRNGRTIRSLTIDTRKRTLTDAAGRATVTDYDEWDNPVKITYPDGSTVTSDYDRYSNITRQVDETGIVTLNEYNASGNLIRRTEAAGLPEQRTTEWTYDGFGQMLTETVKGGAVTLPDGGSVTVPDVTTRYEYDPQGNAITFTDGEGHVTRGRYDPIGNLVALTDPKAGLWSYTYNTHGQLLRETDPLNHANQYAYDKTGYLLSATDALTNRTDFAYDAAGRPTWRTDPLGASLRDEYDAAGQLVSRTDASGKRTRMAYDLLSRITKATDGKGFDIILDYTDGNGQDTGTGRLGRIAYPTFERRYRYDERDRVNQESEIAGAEGLVTSYAYDRVGRTKGVTNPDGKTRSLDYDALGRTTRLADPLGNALTLTWDSRDNVVALTDPLGHTTHFDYDRRGLLVKETDPLGNAATYAFDANGWQTETRLANGKRIAYTRDAAGRLTERRAFDPGDQLKESVTYTYDAADQLTGWNNGVASAALSYDAVGRLTSETLTYDTGVTLGYRYAYHANGQVKSLTYPDNRTVTYGYDANGQLETIDVPGEGRITVTDWKWVQAKRILYPGGTQQERDHDDYLRLTRVRVTNPTQQTVFDLQAKYGKLENVAERKIDGATTLFSYDDAERLTRFDAGLFGASTQNYTLDAAGNRTAHSRVSGTWTYDAANQLRTRGSVSYTYDAAGNLVKKVDALLSEPRKTTEYRYDALNRLAEVIDGAGNPIARYTYDPFDRRLSKETFGAGAAKTHYLQSDIGLLAEADAAGGVLASYGWHPEHPYGSFPLFGRFGDTVGYYHNDQIGAPWRITDRVGSVIWSADYDPFGQAEIDSQSSSIANPLRFPGQYYDSETGLHYNDRRYYDPETGRYLTRDPIGFEGGENLYAYARHNPVNLIDPTGEIIPCLVANYLRCLATCTVLGGVSNALTNCGDPKLGEVLKDCAVDCLLTLIPLPNPCGKFGQWFAAGVGLVGGLLNSFPGETPVHSRGEDGNPALKAIADLRVGDEVLAWAEWKDGKEAYGYEKVTDIIASHKTQRLVHLTLANGEKLTATDGHPFLTTDGWRDAILLKKGGQLLLKGDADDASPRWATIADTRQETRTVRVYNLEVANAHTFFVGKDGVGVHNARNAYPAPGRPTPGTTGGAFVPGKGSGHYRPHADFGGQQGWLDKYGNLWSPTGEGQLAHGDPHYDVQRRGKKGYCNIYPGGRRRGGWKGFPIP